MQAATSQIVSENRHNLKYMTVVNIANTLRKCLRLYLVVLPVRTQKTKKNMGVKSLYISTTACADR